MCERSNALPQGSTRIAAMKILLLMYLKRLQYTRPFVVIHQWVARPPHELFLPHKVRQELEQGKHANHRSVAFPSRWFFEKDVGLKIQWKVI